MKKIIKTVNTGLLFGILAFGCIFIVYKLLMDVDNWFFYSIIASIVYFIVYIIVKFFFFIGKSFDKIIMFGCIFATSAFVVTGVITFACNILSQQLICFYTISLFLSAYIIYTLLLYYKRNKKSPKHYKRRNSY